MPRLKSWLISGVSSVWRVTSPPVNRGVCTSCAGISLGLSTFMMDISFASMVLAPSPGEVYRHPHGRARGLVGCPRPLRLGQPVYDHQHGTDTLKKMLQAQVFVRCVLIVVVICQRHADQRHAERLR